ncbi:hypothetical protein NQ315_002369 [Exocentrus adspersus]|uniref:sn-1-specific diacylglycerol lipase ABHD11 n=1 Tax=Exocentrus adspersus TaxID=1586481 RepID=A0AAV8VTN9_9CUCU|nr:hypothetical protein NQ315_002369 [Exocentrus adspersus]
MYPRSSFTTLKHLQKAPFKCYNRFLSSTETLEPVKLSYATYESTVPEAQAAPLLIMHGLFGSKGNWNSLCKVYQQKTDPNRKIVAIDARNHGDSPHSHNHTYAHMAADIRDLLEQLRLDKVALMGHSMGGRAVMLFALKYPELVDRLIVADMSPVGTSPQLNSMPALFQAVDNVSLPCNVALSQARSLVDAQLAKSIPDKSLRAFLLTNLVQQENGSYKWRINIPVLLACFNNVARFPLVNEVQYTGPVLFLGGGNSDFIETKSSQHYLMRTEHNLDLAYASYELTQSYSKNNPEPVPLVIMHGLMGSKNNWNSFCKKYHDRSRSKVYALDARNHGDSPHSTEHSYDDLAVDIRQFMYKQSLDRIKLLGHSMGGQSRYVVCFEIRFIYLQPELVEKLIVADTSPISTSSNFRRMTRLLAFLSQAKLPKNVSLTEAKRSIATALMPFIKSHAVTSFLLTNLVQKPDGSYTWRFNAKALVNNFENITTFPETHNTVFEGPVLFVGGAKSDHIQKSDFPKILKLFPNAELKFIEGAGHWLHSEKPAEFLQTTLEFLNRKISHH